MKQILKVNNKELSPRLKLNYNNVYSRLRMLLGPKANIFADVRTKSVDTSWDASDDADYTPLTEAPKDEANAIQVALNNKLKAVRNELSKSSELSPFVDEILDVPDDNYIFYRKTDDGYRFVLAGWGYKLAHTGVPDTGGLIKRLNEKTGQNDDPVFGNKDIKTGGGTAGTGDKDKPADTGTTVKTDPEKPQKPEEPQKEEPDEDRKKKSEDDPKEEPEDKPEVVTPKNKKEQHVVIRVNNQNGKPVDDERVSVRTDAGEREGYTDENGVFDLGNLPYHSTFGVKFPDIPAIQERVFEVEPKVEQYDVHIKKFVNYSPILFVDDQNGNVVENYDVKVVISGQDTTFNTGTNGMIQLPTMQEGQKFIVIDSANYANSQEYSVTSENAKAPYKFTIKRVVRAQVGITLLDKNGKPLEGVAIDVNAGTTPCQQTTDKDGRAEFPSEVFSPGDVDLTLYTKGSGTIKTKLNYTPETTEYTIRLQGKKPRHRFNWKWLLLLPVLLLLGIGGKLLYDYMHKKDIPTIDEMETGVAMVIGMAKYSADLNVPINMEDGQILDKVWFVFDKEGKLANVTFDKEKANQRIWTGTGFLISDDGLMATNKHVVDGQLEEDPIKFLRVIMQQQKDEAQRNCDILNDKLQRLAAIGAVNQEFFETRNLLQKNQAYLRLYDKILNTADFKLNTRVHTYAAFTGTRLEYDEDGLDISQLIPLSRPKAVGEPGGVLEKDVAIVQVANKQSIPKDAFVFDVPEEDLMDGEIPDNYEITVIGYNAGLGLQEMEVQDAIKPQAQPGKITNKSEKYRIGYSAATMGGSSGSPVVNNKGELVAINNSGVHLTQGFNYGIRTKYLRELLDEVQKKNAKSPNKTKESSDK